MVHVFDNATVSLLQYASPCKQDLWKDMLHFVACIMPLAPLDFKLHIEGTYRIR